MKYIDIGIDIDPIAILEASSRLVGAMTHCLAGVGRRESEQSAPYLSHLLRVKVVYSRESVSGVSNYVSRECE